LPRSIVVAGWLCALFSALSVWLRSFDPSAFNHDVAYVLYVAGQLLDGRALYVDIVEENLPFVFWWSRPAVALGRALSVAPIAIFNAMLVVGIAGAAALGYRILRESIPANPAAYAFSVVGALCLLEIGAPGYEFGQRDGLFAIAVFPYLFAAAARVDAVALAPRWTLLAGLLAGVGFVLKPHFVVVWIVVEGFLFFRAPGAWKRIENRCIAGVVALGVLAVLAWTPSYLEMIALATRVYDAYATYRLPVLLGKPALIVFAVAVACFFAVRAGSRDRALRQILLVAAMGFLASAVVQGRAWDYHYDPLEIASGLLIVVVGLGFWLRPEGARPFARVSPSRAFLVLWLVFNLVAAGALLRATWQVLGPGAQERTLVGDLAAVAREHAFGRSIWFLSTSIVPAFPVVNLSEARWSSRYCCLWVVPGLYTPAERQARPFPYRTPSEMGALERGLFDAVVEDLQADPPALIFVDQSPDKQAFRRSEFDFLRYFRRDPRFARFFADYTPLTRVGPYAIYRRGKPGEVLGR